MYLLLHLIGLAADTVLWYNDLLRLEFENAELDGTVSDFGVEGTL